VISDLPGVGQNLQDPISINALNFINTPNGQSLIRNPATEPEARRQYFEEAAGPYSSVAGYISSERIPQHLRQSLSIRTREKLATYSGNWPELQYIVGTFLAPNGSSMGSTSARITTPFSRGSVTLESASMSDAPIIDLGWFTDPADGEMLVAGIQRLREVWNTTTARSIRLGPDYLPPANITSDKDILDYIKARANQLWHASSTCSMGKASDRMAVVDSKARVFGVRSLRVVDYSIVPYSLPGHPQATVYMIAEKIADDIRRKLR
jgi:choline dehydrogenase